MVRHIARAALIGLALMVPFAILELINGQNLSPDFPFPLFFVMWLLAATLVLVLTQVLRNLRTGGMNLTSIGRQAPMVFLVALIAWFWVGLVADQMPCFMGIPNCD